MAEPSAHVSTREPGEGFQLSPRVVLLGCLAVIAALYLPTLGFRFVYDDTWTIVDNGFLRQPQLQQLWRPTVPPGAIPDIFRPSAVLFELLAYNLFGLSSPLHHALNVALHLSICALIWHGLGRAGAGLWARALAMTLFGTLAIHVEVVSVVSFREDMLAMLFGLLALRCLDDPRAFSAGRLVLATFLSTTAVMAKMSAAPLAGLWLLTAFLQPFGQRSHVPTLKQFVLGGAALLAGLGLGLTQDYLVVGDASPYTQAATTRVEALAQRYPAMAAQSLGEHLGYLQQIIFPVGLSPEYAPRPIDWGHALPWLAASAFGLALTYAIALLCLLFRQGELSPRRRLWAWCILATLVLALPTSQLVPLTNLRADRFVYWTSLPLCCAVAMEAGRALHATHARTRWLATGLCVLYIVGQGSLAMAASARYFNDTTLWFQAVRVAPRSPRALALRGLAELSRLRNAQPPADALELQTRIQPLCERAAHFDPSGLEPLPHVCRARLAVALKDWQTADQAFKRAHELSYQRGDRFLAPRVQISLDLPGLSKEARLQRAQMVLKSAVREYPYSSALQYAAGRVFHVLGEPETALRHYRRASSLRPERWESAISALELALDLGDAPAARRAWQEISDNPKLRAHAIRIGAAARYRDAQSIWPSTFGPDTPDQASPTPRPTEP